jgi:RNA polymerase sigma-70 factor (family 1)
MTSKTDSLNALFVRIASGEVHALQDVFAQYYDTIYKTALRYCKVHYLAEDITQQVFIILWEKRTLLTNVTNSSAYLGILVRNQTLQTLKKERASASYQRFAIEYQQSEQQSPLEQLVLRQRDQKMELLIQKLSPRQQEVYLLSRYHGATYRQIGAQLGISVETVKEHMANALKILRKSLLASGRDLLWCFVLFLLFF